MLRPDVEINEAPRVLDRKGIVADFLHDMPQPARFRMPMPDDVPNVPVQDNSADHRQRMVAVRLSGAVNLMQPSGQESRIIKFKLAKNHRNGFQRHLPVNEALRPLPEMPGQNAVAPWRAFA